ncbi:MAG: hypothetical protein M5U28_52185 [Sandaracinaceae bacterium]|nr:hypothetical protein [Sandaracinaceae bacterium]
MGSSSSAIAPTTIPLVMPAAPSGEEHAREGAKAEDEDEEAPRESQGHQANAVLGERVEHGGANRRHAADPHLDARGRRPRVEPAARLAHRALERLASHARHRRDHEELACLVDAPPPHPRRALHHLAHARRVLSAHGLALDERPQLERAAGALRHREQAHREATGIGRRQAGQRPVQGRRRLVPDGIECDALVLARQARHRRGREGVDALHPGQSLETTRDPVRVRERGGSEHVRREYHDDDRVGAMGEAAEKALHAREVLRLGPHEQLGLELRPELSDLGRRARR